MRAVWSAPNNNALQGRSNVDWVRINNTLKRQLNELQSQLLMDHQQEDVVSGGGASSIQFHYLLVPDTSEATSSTSIPDTQVFDGNQGSTGSSDVNFGAYETRRDFRNPGRGF